jgi:hypothetical protein
MPRISSIAPLSVSVEIEIKSRQNRGHSPYYIVEVLSLLPIGLSINKLQIQAQFCKSGGIGDIFRLYLVKDALEALGYDSVK